MSAERCGNVMGFVISPPEEREEIAQNSERVSQMLRKIQKLYPYFGPLADSEVWVKARQMGLVEEE